MTPYIKTHIWYLSLIAIMLIFVHVWMRDHDQRVLADAAVKTAQAQVATLQQQISATNAKSAADQAALERAINAVRTPVQAVAEIPKLTGLPLDTRVIPNNPTDVEVAAVPLVQALGQAKETAIALGACQSDLKAETAIAAQKDVEIKALKKKPKFWHRVGSTLKTVAIGIGIGVVAAHAL